MGLTLAGHAGSAVQVSQHQSHSPAGQGLHAHLVCPCFHSWSSQLWLGEGDLARSVGRQEVMDIPTTLFTKGSCMNPAQCRSPVTSGLGTNANAYPFPCNTRQPPYVAFVVFWANQLCWQMVHLSLLVSKATPTLSPL